MKTLLSLVSLVAVAGMVGCTSTETVAHEHYDTRVTGAHHAAHCMNNMSERSGINPKNWNRIYTQECGKDANKYLGNVQFKEFLSDKSNRLVSGSLAE